MNRHKHRAPHTRRQGEESSSTIRSGCHRRRNLRGRGKSNVAVAANHVERQESTCETVASGNSTAYSTSDSTDNTQVVTLNWIDPMYIPLSEEQKMLPALIHWGKSERGMMKDQPEFRLRKVLKMLGTNGRDNHRHRKNTNGNRINLIQSLSLRRHHLKLLNPTLSMPALRLGSNLDIKTSADLFEQCVEAYLVEMGVQFWNEKDQKRIHEENMATTGSMRQPLTPDFRIKNGHSVQLVLTNGKNGRSCNQQPQTIFWIEAKMFYGASTIPQSTNNAVGSILPKARQYVQYYGPGAIVFMYGCGVDLARELKQIGVLALDCRGIDLDRVVRHQVIWCGDDNGRVLF